MTSRRRVVIASKDIWEPQVLGEVGVAGLLSGAFGRDPKGDILERIHQICRNIKVFTYKWIFDIMKIQLFL